MQDKYSVNYKDSFESKLKQEMQDKNINNTLLEMQDKNINNKVLEIKDKNSVKY